MRATDTGRPCLGHAALAMITAAVALTATACASAASSTSWQTSSVWHGSRTTARTTPNTAGPTRAQTAVNAA